MKIEHVAWNVADPASIAEWYVRHLGFRLVRKLAGPTFTHFIADEAGMMVEIYRNPPGKVPDYASMDPLLLHLAFISEDPSADKERLVAAGASVADEQRMDDGTHLVMLRDPWGFSIQFCKRGTPMF